MGTELFSFSYDLWTINELNDCHWSCYDVIRMKR